MLALEVLRPGELPAHYVQRVTAAKLGAARQRLQLFIDTTQALGAA
jgi:hypothetical protein